MLYRIAHEAAMIRALSNLQTQVLWYKQLQDIQDTFKNAANSHDLEYLNVGITCFLPHACSPSSCCIVSVQAVRLAVGAQPDASQLLGCLCHGSDEVIARVVAVLLVEHLSLSEKQALMAHTFTSVSARVPSLLKIPGEIKNPKACKRDPQNKSTKDMETGWRRVKLGWNEHGKAGSHAVISYRPFLGLWEFFCYRWLPSSVISKLGLLAVWGREAGNHSPLWRWGCFSRLGTWSFFWLLPWATPPGLAPKPALLNARYVTWLYSWEFSKKCIVWDLYAFLFSPSLRNADVLKSKLDERKERFSEIS